LTVRDSVLVTLEAPAGVEIDASMVERLPEGGRSSARSLFVQRPEGKVEIRAAFAKAGAYELLVHVRKKGDTGKYVVPVTYRVNAKGGKRADVPGVSAIPLEGGAYLYWPLSERLPAGKPQSFAVSVPNAVEVRIASGAKQTILQKRGDLFVGEMTLNAGQIIAAAFYPKDLKFGPGIYTFVAE